MELFVQNLAVFTLDITKIMVIMHYFLKIKMVRDLKKMFGSLGALLLGSAIFTIFNENRYALFLYLGVVVATSIFLFQMKPLKIIFISMLILIMGSMLDVITKLTISMAFRSQELYENIYISFLCSIITISFLIVIGATHQSKIQGSIATLNVKFLVILFVDIIVNTLVMSFFEYMIKEEQAVMDKPLMVVTVIGVAIGIYVQIGLLIYLAIAKDYLKERNDLNQSGKRNRTWKPSKIQKRNKSPEMNYKIRKIIQIKNKIQIPKKIKMQSQTTRQTLPFLITRMATKNKATITKKPNRIILILTNQTMEKEISNRVFTDIFWDMEQK